MLNKAEKKISYSCRADKDSYPHDGRADKGRYRHDSRADKNPYRHDRRADSLSPYLKSPQFWNLQRQKAISKRSLDMAAHFSLFNFFVVIAGLFLIRYVVRINCDVYH